jgi:Mitochondrial carrier protein
MSPIGSVLLAPSPAGTKHDALYYLKGAAAGGICCSITHGALCPVDVVKTRVQLDPAKVRVGRVEEGCQRWIPGNSVELLRSERCKHERGRLFGPILKNEHFL